MNAGSLGQLTLVLTADDKGFNASLTGADGKVKQLAKSAESSASSVASFSSKASGAFGAVANSIASMAKVAAGAFVSGALGAGTFIKAGSELQSLRASFESLTGSVGDTNKVMDTLYKYGMKTAFRNEDIQSTAKMFLANGVAVQDLMGWMQNLGDVAGATGADLKGLALPLTQAIGSGKMMTQDWYQIINQGAGGLQKYIVAALGAGHSTKTFKDDLEKGAVTADVLKKALALASAEGGMAFRGAIKQSETFNGRMSNLMEAVTNVGLAVIGVDAVTGQVNPGGPFDRLSKAVSDANGWLTENKDQITKVASVIIDNLIPGIAGIATAFTVAKLAAIGFSITAGIAAGTISLPFLLVAGAIAGVAATLAFLQMKFGIFNGVVETARQAFEKFKDFAAPILEALRPLWDFFVSQLMPALTNLGNFVMGQLKSAWDNLVAAVQPFLPVIQIAAVIIGGILIGALIAVVLIIAGFIAAIATLANWISMLLGFVVNLAVGIITWIGNAIATGIWWFMNFQQRVQFYIQFAWNFIVGVFLGMGSWFGDRVNETLSFFRGIPGTIGGFFRDAWNRMVDIFSGIGGWFAGLGGDLVSAGQAIIDGLLRGIQNGKDMVISKVKEIAGGAVDAVKSFLGIHSPSRVFTQIGGFMMQGWGNGIDAMTANVVRSAQSAANSVLGVFDQSPTMKGGLAPAVASGDLYGTGNGGGSGRGGSITQNVYASSNVDMAVINEDLLTRGRRDR